jgi:putative transposase
LQRPPPTARISIYTLHGAARPTPTLTLPELDQRLKTFFLDDYDHQVHGETGVPPQECWEAGGFLPHLPESLEQLDLLLLTVAKPRTVQQDGIHFQGLRYLDLTPSAYIGEPVVIRYDPADLAVIRVYHQNHFLCCAVCQELPGQTISLKPATNSGRALRRVRSRGRVRELWSMQEHR